MAQSRVAASLGGCEQGAGLHTRPRLSVGAPAVAVALGSGTPLPNALTWGPGRQVPPAGFRGWPRFRTPPVTEALREPDGQACDTHNSMVPVAGVPRNGETPTAVDHTG